MGWGLGYDGVGVQSCVWGRVVGVCVIRVGRLGCRGCGWCGSCVGDVYRSGG